MEQSDMFRLLYTSGLYISDPKISSALSLYFPRTIFLNNLEYIQALVKIFNLPQYKKPEHIILALDIDDNIKKHFRDNPFNGMKKNEQISCSLYMQNIMEFIKNYSKLFPHIFYSEVFPEGKLYKIDLIKNNITDKDVQKYEEEKGINIKKIDGDSSKAKNLYSVTPMPLQFTLGKMCKMNKLIREGLIPIIYPGNMYIMSDKMDNFEKLISANYIKFTLPALAELTPALILQYRDYLNDYLSPFWKSLKNFFNMVNESVLDGNFNRTNVDSEMSKLFKKNVQSNIDTLRNKLKSDNKILSAKILSSFSYNLVFKIYNPFLISDMLSLSITLGSNIVRDYANNILKSKKSLEKINYTCCIVLEKDFYV